MFIEIHGKYKDYFVNLTKVKCFTFEKSPTIIQIFYLDTTVSFSVPKAEQERIKELLKSINF